MPEKERVDFSLPDGMDPDTLIPVPLHCISDIFAWMAYTRVIHPQSAFAKDIETIRQAVWDVNKEMDKDANKDGNEVSEASEDADFEEGDALLAKQQHFIIPVLVGLEIHKYPVDFGDILVIEKIENAEENGDAMVTVHFRRYLKRVTLKKSYLTGMVMNGHFVVLRGDSVKMLGG